jgi:putative oxidoreductase
VPDKSEFARLILRAAVGGTMIAHGMKHGKSLKGTAGWFESIGFSQPDLQAKTSAVVEVGAGAALLAGAANPFPAAAVIGTMGVAARSVHAENGFFITSEGYEYVLTLATAAAAIAALGPGTLSLDRLFGRRGPVGAKAGLLAILIGVGGAAGQLKTFWSKPVKA